MKTLTLLTAITLSVLTVTAQESSIRSTISDDVKNTKVFKRFAWEYNQRTYPYEFIPIRKYALEMDREIQKIKNSRLKNSRSLLWTPIGPNGVQPIEYHSYWGIMSGRVRAVAVHPTDTATVYIGAACGGIWKTIDGGESWQDIGRNLESLSFGAIAIDPANPNIVYAGSGESNFLTGIINYYGKGIFKSTDGGQTWIQINDGIGEYTQFGDLEVSPHNSDIVVGALASGNHYLDDSVSNEGIWKSLDAGITWSRTLNVVDAYDILFHPTDPDVIYAAIGGMNDSSGFYISTDQGDTWTQVNAGLQAANTIARMQIDISKSNTNILYAVIYQAGTSTFNGTTRAYKSVDGGYNWQEISAGIPLGGNYGGGWLDQGFYDLCIAVDPEDPDHVFVGNIELHETTDGSNFSPVRPNGNNANGSLVHTDYHKLVFAPSDPDYLYIGCDGGIYKSTDGGVTATSQNTGLETLQFYRIASHPANYQIIIGGMQDNSTAMTRDGGLSWKQVAGGDGMECFFNYNYPDSIIYASTQQGRLLKSNNAGSSFYTIKFVNGAWVTPFFVHPGESNTLYTANKSVFKSVNGQSFEEIAPNVAPVSISTMAQSRVNPDNMIFATGGGDTPTPDSIFIVKISTDGGYTWNDVTTNIPGETRWISRVTTDPVEENTMYVLRTGFSAGNKLYKTSDLGETWTNISGDLPDLPCNDLFIDPDSTHLYVANDLGVYLSTDGGNTWNYASEGMPFVPAIDFDFVNIDGGRYLRVGTHGRSVYETNIDIHVGTPEDKVLKDPPGMIQIYPNPFTNSTTITYELQQPSTVQITIYNHLGKQVFTTAAKRQKQGEYSFSWQAGDLPSGVYYGVLRTDKGMKTVKMIKMK